MRQGSVRCYTRRDVALRILLTNDDGIDAEGLQCLVDVLAKKVECFVVAPDLGRSCCSHAVTTGQSLDIVERRRNQWTVSGTPSDCIRAGLMLLDLKPDLVISGVNHGGNLGVDILYSGTAAGAREASLLGVPSIAISQYMRRDVDRDWILTARRAEIVLEKIVQQKRPGLGFWNINLPALTSQSADLDFPISVCDPERQPLSFSFNEISERMEVEVKKGNNVGPNTIRTVLYKSNYQERPRSLGSDVDLCFSGHATISWLKSDPFELRF